MSTKPQKKTQITPPNGLKDTAIHVMPQIGKKGNRNKSLAKKIGIIIITISIIALIAFVFYMYFYLFQNKATKQKQTNNLIEELDDYELEVPEKIVKKIIEEEEIIPTPIIPNNIDKNKIEKIEIATTSTTSLDLIRSSEDTESNGTTSTNSNTETIEVPQAETNSLVTDSDGDGLSDKEEIILGTDSAASDSDGDEFNDFKELLTLNNPTGDGTIEARENIKKYTNTQLNYSLFYPATWSYTKLSNDGSVKFETTDNQVIQIIAPLNLNSFTIEEWYTTEVSAKRIKQSQRINKNNWEGLKSENGLNAYLVNPNFNERVFVIFYTPERSNVPDYKNIFKMMITSFEINNSAVVEDTKEEDTASTTPEETEDEIEEETATSTVDEVTKEETATSTLDEVEEEATSTLEEILEEETASGTPE